MGNSPSLEGHWNKWTSKHQKQTVKLTLYNMLVFAEMYCKHIENV